MKHLAKAALALGLAAGTAHAGGLDRTYTPVDVIFEKGNYAELSFGYVMPSISGSDLLGNQFNDVAGEFGLAGAAMKLDFGGPWSFALIYDQPYGADTSYGGSPTATLLATTSADAQAHALTALLKYQATDRISLYGGPRAIKAEGEIRLGGLAYGPANGYNVKFSSDTGLGYVAGAAYEIPDIALRAALTYHSAIDLSFNTLESFPAAPGVPGPAVPTGRTNTKTPQSVSLDLQTGIAANTLLFGGVRWSEWSAFTLQPPGLGANLAQLDDTITWELGVGRKFNEKFSGSISISYEDGGSDDLVSPLAPTNGQTAISVGGKYKINDSISLSGGIRYTMFGNARPETGTPDVARGSFRDNDAISAGLKLGINF